MQEIKDSPLKPLVDYFVAIHQHLETETRNKTRQEWVVSLRETNEVLIFLENQPPEKVQYYPINYDAVRCRNSASQILVILLGKERLAEIEKVFRENSEKDGALISLLNNYLFEEKDPRRWDVIYEKTIIPGVYIASAEQPSGETGKNVRYSYGLLKVHLQGPGIGHA